MLKIPFDPLFAENMDRTNSHGDAPCIVCGLVISVKSEHSARSMSRRDSSPESMAPEAVHGPQRLYIHKGDHVMSRGCQSRV
jgi:hypothetical protein